MKSKLSISKHDEDLVQHVLEVIRTALKNAEVPTVVAKRIMVVAVSQRNKGRSAAIRSHPFSGVCEATGKLLDPRDKVLDELEPEKGYEGKLRWVCPKCNNSGNRSC